MKLNDWFLSNKLFFIGGFIGAVARFLYWKFSGCSSGGCAITSTALNCTLYFTLAGALTPGPFKKQKR